MRADGLGRGIATAFAEAGAPVVAVSRTAAAFPEPANGAGTIAARSGQPMEEYLQHVGPLVTPDIAGAALVELVQADPATTAPGYRLTGAGLQKLP